MLDGDGQKEDDLMLRTHTVRNRREMNRHNQYNNNTNRARFLSFFGICESVLRVWPEQKQSRRYVFFLFIEFCRFCT